MKVATYEAIVENGQIKLTDVVKVSEHAKAYVVVTGVEEIPSFHVGSPRLARRELADDFRKEVSEEPDDVGI